MGRTIAMGVVVGSVLICLAMVVCGCGGSDRATVQTEPESGPVVQAAPAPQVSDTPSQRVESGVSEPNVSELAVDLSLRLAPGRTAKYKATLEQGRSVSWAGVESTRPADFKDGHTGNRVEMVFEQAVESVDASGDAVARITVVALTYLNRNHNNVVLDFDSARQEDGNNPLSKLTGQTYRIKFSRAGEVLEVADVGTARAAVAGSSPEHQVAQRLLSDSEIKGRHAIPPLMALKGQPVRRGQSWSDEKRVSFSSMGSKLYERVYTLGSVFDNGGARPATVEMKAIPAVGQMPGQLMLGPFAGTTDSTDTYDGRLVLDLATGEVREYTDQMHAEWVIVDPQSVQGQADLSAVRMTAMRVQRLEQVR